MRRRRLLALGAAAAGLAGCAENKAEDQVLTRPGTATEATQSTERTEEAPETTTGSDGAATPSIGGSLNGRPFRLGDELAIIEESGAEWLHAFLDVRRKLSNGVSPREDPDVAALRRAKREAGANLVVALQWDFIGLFPGKPQVNVPGPGTDREQRLFEYGVALLEAIGEPVDVVGLGNEPVWETKDEDFLGPDAPLVVFTRNLKEYLVEHYAGEDTDLVVGALNRLYTDDIRTEYGGFYEALFDMARTDDDVDGVDLHIHYESLEQAEEMFEVARRTYPEGLLTVTEFSPMWRYEKHVTESISSFEGGGEFARRHGVAGGMTVGQYFEAAKTNRLSEAEIADFYETMPWYNVNFVEDMYDLLERYDVDLGAFCFLVDEGATNADWTTDWAPFQINCLFQPPIIDTEYGTHPHYIDDFRRRA